jgi:hypothetical protein
MCRASDRRWSEGGVIIDGDGSCLACWPDSPFNSVVAQPDTIKMGTMLALPERHAMLGPLSRPDLT